MRMIRIRELQKHAVVVCFNAATATILQTAPKLTSVGTFAIETIQVTVYAHLVPVFHVSLQADSETLS